MINAFDVPKSGDPLTALGPVVQALARSGNGMRGLRWEAGDDWHFEWAEGGAVLTYPRHLDDGGSGGNGGNGSGGGGTALGPCVFAGTASGEVAYFLVNCDGVAYSSPPSGYPTANPL